MEMKEKWGLIYMGYGRTDRRASAGGQLKRRWNNETENCKRNWSLASKEGETKKEMSRGPWEIFPLGKIRVLLFSLGVFFFFSFFFGAGISTFLGVRSLSPRLVLLGCLHYIHTHLWDWMDSCIIGSC